MSRSPALTRCVVQRLMWANQRTSVIFKCQLPVLYIWRLPSDHRNTSLSILLRQGSSFETQERFARKRGSAYSTSHSRYFCNGLLSTWSPQTFIWGWAGFGFNAARTQCGVGFLQVSRFSSRIAGGRAQRFLQSAQGNVAWCISDRGQASSRLRPAGSSPIHKHAKQTAQAKHHPAK